ncbi:MAG: hypothetical protein NC819_01030 [Candidatus Omnitrophica bacterium]|nr:hypothetical protein [Candidatus Omnitrophota bacterium]
MGGILLLLGTAFFFSAASPLLASTEDEPVFLSPAAQASIEAIKRRAQELAERKKAEEALYFYGELSQGVGYESNPSNLPAHSGSTFSESAAYLFLSKRILPDLFWQGFYYGSLILYTNYNDGDYALQTLTPVRLLWRLPPTWRLEAGVHLEWLDYLDNKSVDYLQAEPFVGTRQNLCGNWYHLFQYGWFIRDYLSTRARSGQGQATLSSRQDTRHTFRHEIGTLWRDTLFQARQEWYLNDSNDARRDFYDAQDYKVTALVSRPFLPKWTLNASFSFERKNYRKRRVGGISAEARYDDIKTWIVSGRYGINKTWSVVPTFSYRSLDSNEPTGEYVDVIHSISVTARF